MLKDNDEKYGLLSKLFHWLSAISIFTLFGLGIWMVDLTYYSEWYKTAPYWHKSVGVLLLLFTLARLLWKLLTPSPNQIKTHSVNVQKSAKLVHIALYVLMFIIMFSGYFISTADGRGIEVFNWFELPSLGELIDNQEDIAGNIHRYSAYTLIILASLHAIAAFKHHIIEKDHTLKRML